MKMKVIVTGGRDYSNRKKVYEVLDKLNPDVVVQGGAPGADYLAREWALYRGKKSLTYGVDWEKHGKAAGPIRNREMLAKNSDAIVVPFPGGRGTANCVNEAIRANMRVYSVHE